VQLETGNDSDQHRSPTTLKPLTVSVYKNWCSSVRCHSASAAWSAFSKCKDNLYSNEREAMRYVQQSSLKHYSCATENHCVLQCPSESNRKNAVSAKERREAALDRPNHSRQIDYPVVLDPGESKTWTIGWNYNLSGWLFSQIMVLWDMWGKYPNVSGYQTFTLSIVSFECDQCNPKTLAGPMYWNPPHKILFCV